MFNSYGSNPVAVQKSCKEDLEIRASYMKKRMNADENFLTAAKEFIKNGSFDDMDSSRNILFGMVGALSMKTEDDLARFEKLLKEIEKENPDSNLLKP